MSNAKLKLFDLKLDRTRKVRMDLGALEDAEDLSGHNYLARGFDGMNAKALRALVWASVKHEDPDLTPDSLRELIHMGNAEYVSETMARAYVQSMPEKKEKGAKPEAAEDGDAPLAES